MNKTIICTFCGREGHRASHCPLRVPCYDRHKPDNTTSAKSVQMEQDFKSKYRMGGNFKTHKNPDRGGLVFKYFIETLLKLILIFSLIAIMSTCAGCGGGGDGDAEAMDEYRAKREQCFHDYTTPGVIAIVDHPCTKLYPTP